MGCNASKVTNSNSIVWDFDDDDDDLKQMKEFEIVAAEDPIKMLQMMNTVNTTGMGASDTKKAHSTAAKPKCRSKYKEDFMLYPRRPKRKTNTRNGSSGSNINSKGKSSSSSRPAKTFGLGADKFVYEKIPRSEGIDGILNFEENNHELLQYSSRSFTVR